MARICAENCTQNAVRNKKSLLFYVWILCAESRFSSIEAMLMWVSTPLGGDWTNKLTAV